MHHVQFCLDLEEKETPENKCLFKLFLVQKIRKKKYKQKRQSLKCFLPTAKKKVKKNLKIL